MPHLLLTPENGQNIFNQILIIICVVGYIFMLNKIIVEFVIEEKDKTKGLLMTIALSFVIIGMITLVITIFKSVINQSL